MPPDKQALLVSASHPAGVSANIPGGDTSYWYELINEREAGRFVGLTDRTMQAHRQRGGGSRYIALSKRCVRYRRIDLKEWADTRVRRSTSDPGPESGA